MEKEEVQQLLSQELDKDAQRDRDLSELREITRADLFKDIIRPDFQRERGISINPENETTISPFTKDMKTSFLETREIEILKEITDMAIEWARLGATAFAIDRFIGRETWLALAPSKNAALLRLMNTEYGIKTIKFDKSNKSFFKRGSDRGEQYG